MLDQKIRSTLRAAYRRAYGFRFDESSESRTRRINRTTLRIHRTYCAEAKAYWNAMCNDNKHSVNSPPVLTPSQHRSDARRDAESWRRRMNTETENERNERRH